MAENKKIHDNEYYGNQDKIGKYLSQVRNQAVLEACEGKLIDFGCGDGQLIHSYSGEADGVDITDYGAASIIASDFSKLPVSDKSYDTATIVASLNYFDNPEAVLKETYRILRKDGRLILTMPNATVMKIWHKFREPWANNSGFTRNLLIEMASNAGYKLESQKRFLFGLNARFTFTKA